MNNNISINSDLNVSGNSLFNGIVTINSNLHVSGNSILNDVTINLRHNSLKCNDDAETTNKNEKPKSKKNNKYHIV